MIYDGRREKFAAQFLAALAGGEMTQQKDEGTRKRRRGSCAHRNRTGFFYTNACCVRSDATFTLTHLL